MAVSCILFEITRDIGRKTPIFHSSLPFNLHDHLYIETLRIISQNFNTNCPSSWVIKWCKDIAEKFNLMSRVQKRYRRHTDDRRIGDDISNVSLKRLFSLNSPGASTLRMGVKGNLELLTQFFFHILQIFYLYQRKRQAEMVTSALVVIATVVVATTCAELPRQPEHFKIGFLAPWNGSFDDFSALTSASAISIAIERVHSDPTLNKSMRFRSIIFSLHG